VLERLLEKKYEEGNDDFLQLADIYTSGRSDDGLKELILQLYGYAQSYPWPKEWLLDALHAYQMDSVEKLSASAAMESLMSYIRHMLSGVMQKLDQCLDICLSGDGPDVYEKTVTSDREQIVRLTTCETYQELFEQIRLIEFVRLASSRGYDGNPQKLSYVKDARDSWKKTITKMREKYFFSNVEDTLEQMKRLLPVAASLIHLTDEFSDALAIQKREKNIVDFGDLEHFALQIFRDKETKELTDTAREFQRAYAEIMIDEYQDSNHVQEEILTAISREKAGENNLFMVGDVKQSIYRFRLARPELFMDKYDAYTLEDSEKQKVDLSKNFRSRDEILAVTNDIFSQIMHKSLGNVEYDKAAALYPGADYPKMQGMYEPEVLLADSEDELLTDMEDTGKVELEALLLADKIRDLKKNQLVLDEKSGQLRNVNYSDIVILLRSLNGYADVFAKVLMEHGIPAHTTSKTGYFSTLEVQTILNYLRILDNPLQDIPLAAVLKSSIGGFFDEDLAWIAISNKGESFSTAFFHGLRDKLFEEQLQQKAEAFYCTYEVLRNEVSDRPIHELLMDVLEKTGYRELVAAMPAGRQRQANIAMLVEKAIAYEGTSYRGLFHFIRYIDELQNYDIDFGEADLVSENEDAVRIMSIHKSKGLEFPVVFVSGLGKQFNRQDARSRMILHPNLGIGLDEIDSNRRLRIPTLQKRIVAGESELENLGEELRILYVALTRPKEKLILTGVKKKAEEWLDNQRVAFAQDSKMSFLDISDADCYLDWIVPALLTCGDKYHFGVTGIADMIVEEIKDQVLEEKMQKEEAEWQAYPPEEVFHFVKERLSYQYPYQNSVDLKMKYSVSELKHRAMRIKAQEEELDTIPTFLEPPVIPYIPAFAGDVTETVNQGALRGTAVHRVLECLDFASLSEDGMEAELQAQIDDMLDQGKITEDMKSLVNLASLKQFLESELAKRMRAAAKRGELFREKPFVLGRQEEELILIQGIIDVFWIEDDRIMLLDYKTDRISHATQLIDRYQEQLELYAKAIEATWNKKVGEKYLYSFSLQETICLQEERN
jgi:ATP-dependent helicase/nuclease subunit A